MCIMQDIVHGDDLPIDRAIVFIHSMISHKLNISMQTEECWKVSQMSFHFMSTTSVCNKIYYVHCASI